MCDFKHYSELYHHGIKGMRWGVRRYQNSDGTLTELGKKRRNMDNDEAYTDYLKKYGYSSKKRQEFMKEIYGKDRINKNEKLVNKVAKETTDKFMKEHPASFMFFKDFTIKTYNKGYERIIKSLISQSKIKMSDIKKAYDKDEEIKNKLNKMIKNVQIQELDRARRRNFQEQVNQNLQMQIQNQIQMQIQNQIQMQNQMMYM